MILREFEFENGDLVVEKITGFLGTITGTCFYLTGCNQYLITGKSDKGKEADAIWYDEGRLKLVKKQKWEVEAAENGCDKPPMHGKRGA